jgi:hypothetical protein
MLLFFITCSLFLSLLIFGAEETFSFISQQKQNPRVYIQGGSWNLHLPSSHLLIFLIPVYLFVIRKVWKRDVQPNWSGAPYFFFGLFLLFFGTLIFNRGKLAPFITVWSDPRYLAHSVRELITFPLTYFPLPLFFIFSAGKNSPDFRPNSRNRKMLSFIIAAAVIFLVGLAYQSCQSFSAGIGELAQKPAFAHGDKLGIPYLLASHFFEHFLDTAYFTLLCLLLYTGAIRQRNKKEQL